MLLTGWVPAWKQVSPRWTSLCSGALTGEGAGPGLRGAAAEGAADGSHHGGRSRRGAGAAAGQVRGRGSHELCGEADGEQPPERLLARKAHPVRLRMQQGHQSVECCRQPLACQPAVELVQPAPISVAQQVVSTPLLRLCHKTPKPLCS